MGPSSNITHCFLSSSVVGSPPVLKKDMNSLCLEFDDFLSFFCKFFVFGLTNLLKLSGLVNRFMWMQEAFPVHSGDILLFKTPVSFIDHLQEILAPVLSCTPLIIPPSNDLKAYPFYLVDILKVNVHIVILFQTPQNMWKIFCSIWTTSLQ